MPPSALPHPRVLVVGDVMTDVIVRPEGPLVIGSDRRAKIGLYPGGSACNQAAWLAYFGIPVAFAGRVGKRDLATQEEALREAGVTPLLAAGEGENTGMLIAIISETGERSFLTDRGANDGLSAADLPFSLLDGLELLHVSGYALFTPGPRAAVMALMAVARARGITVTVDPASVGFLEEVGPSNFLGWTSDATIMFPNAEEAACLAGTSDPAAQIRFLTARYELVAIKRGAEGAEIASKSVRLRAAAPDVAVVDTTGAGDAFLAAFLAARLENMPIDKSLERAVRAGARATTMLGGRPAKG
ncbi:PfkB family carbohydrate kinase [Kaistia dalseonensis]|uniref:Sugar/nucleoside kinase (Ribokinase family) n=1 Tax=Kaistia dalseonensis TaxID=410840 RepID=A0ABU0HDA7_9HYPH|nr:PfkB family carbohydrate kinase [Kaistia dalseonensis]MCX5497660.1 PfkB family carbohydrate kinase [Kaistia dalseonensis]MDQ0440304.1 sugar/nucleoside kinase (ribokinase family) [Kaistia dalseonensis]